MKSKLSADEIMEFCLYIQQINASTESVIAVIQKQALPIASQLSHTNIDPSRKLFKSLSALEAASKHQCLRFAKLINLLNANKLIEVIKLLNKINSKNDKLVAELHLLVDKFEDYMLIVRKQPELSNVHAACKSCISALIECIIEFEIDTKHLHACIGTRKD